MRRKLIAVALNLLRGTGLEGVTIDAVCRAAGLPTAVVLGHFPNRRALIEALLEEALDDFILSSREGGGSDPVALLQERTETARIDAIVLAAVARLAEGGVVNAKERHDLLELYAVSNHGGSAGHDVAVMAAIGMGLLRLLRAPLPRGLDRVTPDDLAGLAVEGPR